MQAYNICATRNLGTTVTGNVGTADSLELLNVQLHTIYIVKGLNRCKFAIELLHVF